MSENDLHEVEYYSCSCIDKTHLFIVTRHRWAWKDEEWEENLDIHTELNHFLPWYKRVVNAVRYIFALDSRWYHFSEVMMNPSDAERLVKQLQDFIDSPYSRDETHN